MKRKAWKWIFGISLAGLILLVLFTLWLWVMLNVCGALLLTLMGNQEIHAMPISEFLSNFVGSPMFYIYLVDISALLASIIALIVTKKRDNTQQEVV